MIMTTIIKPIMPGLMAAAAFAVIGASASAALSPKDLGIHRTALVQESQQLDTSQAVRQAAWSEQDQQMFWEQGQDRGG
jgi:hypothetical protein